VHTGRAHCSYDFYFQGETIIDGLLHNTLREIFGTTTKHQQHQQTTPITEQNLRIFLMNGECDIEEEVQIRIREFFIKNRPGENFEPIFEKKTTITWRVYTRTFSRLSMSYF
jgi:hypothetical protein